LAGQVKTRLCPPCTPAEAARLAEASLADTLAAVAATPAAWRAVALEGRPGPWLVDDLAVVAQRGRGLDERLAAAVEDAGARLGPPAATLVIGADTPQVTPQLLAAALDVLCLPEVDAVLGPAPDGGYWAIGLRRADDRAFVGVPMSSPSTGAAQLDRLRELGLAVRELAACRDVDTFADALAVAAAAPRSRFAAAVASLGAGPRGSGAASEPVGCTGRPDDP